jgi:SUMO ligase MMS21 Smc5/6 complex component
MAILENPLTSSEPFRLFLLFSELTSVCSTVCGHSFSGTAIRQYLRASREQKKQCPASGCRKWICESDLKEDKDLEKRAKAAARRIQAMEADENSDEYEVIE